jgi:DNA-binding transcriptional ArsR family regulator
MTPHAAARMPQPPPVDAIFRALSDPTRRHVIERLSRSPASVSELAKPHDMALPSFVAHLKVLETSGLVSSRKVGRVRTYRLESGPMKLAEDWLETQRTMWARRLDRHDAYVLTLKEDMTE